MVRGTKPLTSSTSLLSTTWRWLPGIRRKQPFSGVASSRAIQMENLALKSARLTARAARRATLLAGDWAACRSGPIRESRRHEGAAAPTKMSLAATEPGPHGHQWVVRITQWVSFAAFLLPAVFCHANGTGGGHIQLGSASTSHVYYLPCALILGCVKRLVKPQVDRANGLYK